MPKRRSAKTETATPAWLSCAVCNLQMTGGPRCYTHNPTPEERERLNLPVVKFSSKEVVDEEDEVDA